MILFSWNVILIRFFSSVFRDLRNRHQVQIGQLFFDQRNRMQTERKTTTSIHMRHGPLCHGPVKRSRFVDFVWLVTGMDDFEFRNYTKTLLLTSCSISNFENVLSKFHSTRVFLFTLILKNKVRGSRNYRIKIKYEEHNFTKISNICYYHTCWVFLEKIGRNPIFINIFMFHKILFTFQVFFFPLNFQLEKYFCRLYILFRQRYLSNFFLRKM